MSKAPIADRDAYRTPLEVFFYLQHKFGKVAYDTACTKANALATPVWTLPGFKKGDALSHPWPDKKGLNLFCNPPYSRGNIEQYVGMASQLRKSSVFFLIPPSNGEIRYQWLQDNCLEINIIGRIAFRHPTANRTENSPRGGSSIFITNPTGFAMEGERWTEPLDTIFAIGQQEMGL